MTRFGRDFQAESLVSKLGKRVIIGGIATAVTVLGAVGLYESFTTYIKPNEYGIKVSKLNGGKAGGIEEHIYEGGELYWEGIGQTYLRFPKDWQNLDFNNNPIGKELEEKVRGYNQEPEQKISSKDGFINDFEITIIYRITNPLTVIHKVGMGKQYDDYVRTKAGPALKETLGSILAEELYNEPKRNVCVAKAKTLLNTELNDDGIEVKEILVRNFGYNPEYDKKIKGKVLQGQLEIRNREQGKAEKVSAAVQKIIADGEAAVEVEKERALAEETTRTAAADNYKRTKIAEGDLLVKQAEAEGQRLLNAAYEGHGSDGIVALQMAEKTAGAIKTVYVKSCADGSGINPLDLNALLKRFTKQ